MPKRFEGDATHRLPMGLREPYRLWFEFVKLTLSDPNLRVSKRYASWGDIKHNTFDKWWNTHWREMFAVRIGTTEVRTAAQLTVARSNDNLVLAVPRDMPIASALREVRKQLQVAHVGTRERIRRRASNAPFRIDAVNLKYEPLQRLLRIYRYDLKHQGDAQKIAHDEWIWTRQRNKWVQQVNAEREAQKRKRWRKIIKQQGWKSEDMRALIELESMDTALADKGIETRETQQRAMWRLLRKARRIAKNVARGSFPGKYSNV